MALEYDNTGSKRLELGSVEFFNRLVICARQEETRSEFFGLSTSTRANSVSNKVLMEKTSTSLRPAKFVN